MRGLNNSASRFELQRAIGHTDMWGTNTRFVLNRLIDYMHPEKFTSYPSQATLAMETGMCERTVRRALDELTVAGVISIVRAGRRGNIYMIHWSVLNDLARLGFERSQVVEADQPTLTVYAVLKLLEDTLFPEHPAFTDPKGRELSTILTMIHVAAQHLGSMESAGMMFRWAAENEKDAVANLAEWEELGSNLIMYLPDWLRNYRATLPVPVG